MSELDMFGCIHGPGLKNNAELVNCAYAFSPLVEKTSEHTVVLDIDGCDLLFGAPREIAKEIGRHAADLGLKVNIAIAQNPDAAIHAARRFPGITIIAPGKEAGRLGELPLEALDTSLAGVEADRRMEILNTLELWGIRTFRDFAVLPEAGVSERLGPDGVRLQKLARGEVERPLLLAEAAPEFEKSIELDDPIDLLEPLSFIIARLLNQLCANLQAHGLATSELRIRLKLEDKTEQDRAIRLPFPMRDGKVFLKLLLLDIESHPPGSAIVGVSITGEPARPRSIQNGLFQPLAPEPEKLELTLARLIRLVGEKNVGSPELLDTHRPGAFLIRQFRMKFRGAGGNRRGRRIAAKAGTRSLRSNQHSATRNRQSVVLGFRVFRPPLRVEVEVPNGWPVRIRTPSASGRSIRGKVLRLAGPWRTTGDWWAGDRWARDEWDVTVGGVEASPEKGTLYRIYQDLRSGAWFVEGIYD